jgi:class 3 adenylate cyclase
VARSTAITCVTIRRREGRLVSSTVRDLVAGSGLPFTEHGRHILRGIAGDWQLFAAEGWNR